MKIRDSFATLNGDSTVYEMPSGGLEIVADDGRPLFGIRLKDGVLHIDSGMVCKHEGRMLDDRFAIKPVAANCVDIEKLEYS